MELWSRARSFAEEAAKRSQEISSTISGSKLTDIVSETAKRSKELAAEASNHIKAEALKRADQIKSLSLLDPSLPLTLPVSLSPLAENSKQVDPDPDELERFGVTDDLREFLKTLSISTFQDFPLLGKHFCFLGSIFSFILKWFFVDFEYKTQEGGELCSCQIFVDQALG